MIKVGIVGCGKIADAHAEQIRRIPSASLVAVCDTEPLMARQFSDRFVIPAHFADVEAMLDRARPDVVHVTTPPQSHYSIGMRCLQAGCHVYMEKPFAVNEEETFSLLQVAEQKSLRMTVGHDYQFTHAKRRMRTLVKAGYLGTEPVHIESYHCYELGSETYAKALLGDKDHWVRKLPGRLLHNNISHGICAIAEFLTESDPQVVAAGFSSPLLRGMGETDIVDELRVIITEKSRRTAYFTFSSQMRPVLHGLAVYGTHNGIVVDHDQQTCIKIPGARRKSYLEKFVSPASLGKQYFQQAASNVRLFLNHDFHMKSGMKNLIESFYKSIQDGAADPISHREIVLTARIMDQIFAQLVATRDRKT
jgi:predicted dehydrogenase